MAVSLIPVLPPVVVPDYLVCDKIGSGGYADVYKAYKRSSGGRECVAIKAVLRSTLSPGSTESLLTEIRLLKRLNHDHIVQLKDFMYDTNYIYIVMEYCAGGDLSHFIKSKHRLPENACQRFLQQLASALKYMRDENVSHFDLKPQNILLASRKNPVLKIGDFGLAQLMPESESASKVKGSPLYMAPEILLEKKYDAKVDLWSVGVILYECLFGNAPYSSATMEELIQRIKSDKQIKLPPNTSVSPKCQDLLVRCLERDPHKRIEFEEFFQHPFVDLEHKPSPANMEKARNLLKQAVELDERQEYETALVLYTESLLYLVPNIHVEPDAQRKHALRQRVAGYLDRTEQLKCLLSQQGISCPSVDIPSLPHIPTGDQPEPNVVRATLRTSSSQEHDHHLLEVNELLKLSSTTPTMSDALEIAISGEHYEQEGSFSIALEKYELALGKLLNLLSSEPVGRRRDLLISVIKRWMGQAEEIKRLVHVAQSKLAEDIAPASEAKGGSAKGKKEENGGHKSSEKKKTDKTKQYKKKEKNPDSSITVLSPFSGIVVSASSTSRILSEADYEKNCSIQ